MRGLRVASRTSSFRFRDGATDAREIGRTLNVAAIMEGSVRKAGERVRVTAQLIDAGNGYHLWSENFDRELEDIFAIQEEIARSIVRALRVSLQAPRCAGFRAQRAARHARLRVLPARPPTAGDEVHVTWTARAARCSGARSRSIPDYAQAHAGLADALVELLLWRLARPATC